MREKVIVKEGKSKYEVKEKAEAAGIDMSCCSGRYYPDSKCSGRERARERPEGRERENESENE